MASKRLQTTLRRLSSLLNVKSRFLPPPQPPTHLRLFLPRILEASRRFNLRSAVPPLRTFSSLHSEGPTAIDYRSTLQEDEFHSLANSTIHELQERFEEYGDIVQIDGFDIDYGNEVLTLKLGDLGTYVLNKQTPNRQLWLSSPVSGPSRFDWDQSSQTWVYRRTKANLLKILESELDQLCGEPIKLA